MKVISGIGRVKKIERPVVVLGVFDGLHRGHIRILKELTRYAKQVKGKSVVITFSPHPQGELHLYSLGRRIRLFEKIGIDICVVIRFTPSFARVSASEFIDNYLIKKIHPYSIFVGKNFTFGKGGRGKPSLLKKYAKRYNVKLKIFPICKIKGKSISSTYIRRLILTGQLSEAARFLGRPVSILGTVVKGSNLARYLGFPTANIKAHHEVSPPAGVYMVRVNLDNKTFNGICYIGSRPTFKTHNAKHIEVHIFRFNKNIYARDLEIQFIKKIREERKFKSARQLTEQIKKDISLYPFPPLLRS